MKRSGGILFIIIFMLLTVAGFAFIFDFSGIYVKLPSINDPWCGKSIDIKKIRLNKYRISWELITGEKSIVELTGKVKGDMIDFRKDNYGYTYALSDNKKYLTVTLTIPQKTIICHFEKETK